MNPTERDSTKSPVSLLSSQKTVSRNIRQRQLPLQNYSQQQRATTANSIEEIKSSGGLVSSTSRNYVTGKSHPEQSSGNAQSREHINSSGQPVSSTSPNYGTETSHHPTEMEKYSRQQSATISNSLGDSHSSAVVYHKCWYTQNDMIQKKDDLACSQQYLSELRQLDGRILEFTSKTVENARLFHSKLLNAFVKWSNIEKACFFFSCTCAGGKAIVDLPTIEAQSLIRNALVTNTTLIDLMSEACVWFEKIMVTRFILDFQFIFPDDKNPIAPKGDMSTLQMLVHAPNVPPLIRQKSPERSRGARTSIRTPL